MGACVIKLIHELPGTHGVHVTRQTEERTRFAEKMSVSRSEFYAAGTMGLAPTAVFKLALAEEYDEERELKYGDRLFDIIRTYETADGGIELTAQRRNDG